MSKKIAIVHDWLTNMGGAEPTVLKLHEIFPNAPIYTSVYDKKRMPAFAGCDVRTTWLQKVLPPFLRYKHVLWPVLRAFAFKSLDLSEYDIIISSASAEAKAVRKRPDALHICYCHTPTRYYWSHYQEFKRDFNFGLFTPLIRPFIPAFVRWMRKLDLRAAKGVDYYIANSHETQARIKKYYGRESAVIFPPVDINRFNKKPAGVARRNGFLMWGRHVPYKRFDLGIEACNQLRLPLIISGIGPETKRLQKMAGSTVKFVGRVSDEEIVRLTHTSEALLFPGEEDLGLVPVEAMGAGLPVIAYGRGGALDYVLPGKTGVLFKNQTAKGLVQAIKEFQKTKFNHDSIHQFSTKFSEERFVKEIDEFIANKL